MNTRKSLIVFLFLVLVSAFSVQAQNPPCCMLGDASGEGNVTALDLVTIQQHLLGLTCLSEQALCQSDVDGDGVLTQNDRQLIQEYILGIRETFPRCGDLDGDGKLEWESGGDDINAFTTCYVQDPKGCPNADADNDGDYDQQDFFLFSQHANGNIKGFPGCACGEGACR